MRIWTLILAVVIFIGGLIGFMLWHDSRYGTDAIDTASVVSGHLTSRGGPFGDYRIHLRFSGPGQGPRSGCHQGLAWHCRGLALDVSATIRITYNRAGRRRGLHADFSELPTKHDATSLDVAAASPRSHRVRRRQTRCLPA